MNVELSTAAFDIVWSDLRLARVPFPLEVRSHGDTTDERARLEVAVHRDLERRGLSRGGRVAAELADALALLANPVVAVDLIALLDPAESVPLKAVAVARKRRALLAVQRERTIRLTSVRDTMLGGTIVDLLPHTRAASGGSITQPASALLSMPPRLRRSQPGGVLRTSAPRTAMDAKLRELVTIAELPVQAAGQLGITLIGDRGERQRLPGIAWFDTDRGRYATTIRRGAEGEDWVTVWPADNARLAHRIGELLAANS